MSQFEALEPEATRGRPVHVSELLDHAARSLESDMGTSPIAPVRTPFQAPNANAYAERFVRSIKEECLDRMVLFGAGHLRRVIDQYVEHYHGERNHQGIGNDLIEGKPGSVGEIACHERLGGLLKFYHRAA